MPLTETPPTTAEPVPIHHLGPQDVEAYAAGCALLGSGGGGDVGAAALLLRRTLGERGPLQVVRPGDLPEDTLVCFAGAVGSPTVMLERLPGDREFGLAVTALRERLGRPIGAVAPLEIGGVNGLLGLVAPAHLGLPALDVDAMGRAFPRLDLTVLADRVPATPAVLATSSGGTILLDRLDAATLEQAVRGLLPAVGTWAAVALHSCTVAEAARYAVPGSISRALSVGSAAGPAPGRRPVGAGTVVQVRRDGASRGGVLTLDLDEDAGVLRVDFSDEHVLAVHDGMPVAWAPDIIALVDERTGRAVTVDALRPGQHLTLSVLPAPAAVAQRADLLGPAAYGLLGWDE